MHAMCPQQDSWAVRMRVWVGFGFAFPFREWLFSSFFLHFILAFKLVLAKAWLL